MVIITLVLLPHHSTSTALSQSASNQLQDEELRRSSRRCPSGHARLSSLHLPAARSRRYGVRGVGTQYVYSLFRYDSCVLLYAERTVQISLGNIQVESYQTDVETLKSASTPTATPP